MKTMLNGIFERVARGEIIRCKQDSARKIFRGLKGRNLWTFILSIDSDDSLATDVFSLICQTWSLVKPIAESSRCETEKKDLTALMQRLGHSLLIGDSLPLKQQSKLRRELFLAHQSLFEACKFSEEFILACLQDPHPLVRMGALVLGRPVNLSPDLLEKALVEDLPKISPRSIRRIWELASTVQQADTLIPLLKKSLERLTETWVNAPAESKFKRWFNNGTLNRLLQLGVVMLQRIGLEASEVVQVLRNLLGLNPGLRQSLRAAN